MAKKKKKIVKKTPVKLYYSSQMRVNNIEFVAILIRFLGTCALPFCLRWANTLVHCDTCSTQVKPRRSEFPRYLVSGEKCTLCTALRLVPMLNMRHSAQVVLAQWKQNGSVPVPQNRMSITTNSVLKFYFTSDVILKITKSEEYYSFTGFFLHKFFFFLEQKGISATALIHVAKTESLSTCRTALVIMTPKFLKWVKWRSKYR